MGDVIQIKYQQIRCGNRKCMQAYKLAVTASKEGQPFEMECRACGCQIKGTVQKR